MARYPNCTVDRIKVVDYEPYSLPLAKNMSGDVDRSLTYYIPAVYQGVLRSERYPNLATPFISIIDIDNNPVVQAKEKISLTAATEFGADSLRKQNYISKETKKLTGQFIHIDDLSQTPREDLNTARSEIQLVDMLYIDYMKDVDFQTALDNAKLIAGDFIPKHLLVLEAMKSKTYVANVNYFNMLIERGRIAGVKFIGVSKKGEVSEVKPSPEGWVDWIPKYMDMVIEFSTPNSMIYYRLSPYIGELGLPRFDMIRVEKDLTTIYFDKIERPMIVDLEEFLFQILKYNTEMMVVDFIRKHKDAPFFVVGMDDWDEEQHVGSDFNMRAGVSYYVKFYNATESHLSSLLKNEPLATYNQVLG